MRGTRRRTTSAAVMTAWCLLVVAPAAASAAFMTGLSGNEYTSSDSSERDRWFDETTAAGAEVIRVNVLWSATVSGRPTDPYSPMDPAYDFGDLDAAVQDAAERNIEVMVTLYGAPAFAEGPDRAASAPAGTWKPDPAEYAAFARAVASRYSGSFQGLSRVRYFQAWNEPNLSPYLNPQWDGGRAFAASHYRRMLNAFDEAVHGVRGDNVVVTAGTAPFGDTPGGNRIRPLRFWREVLCLKKKNNGKLKGASCPEKAEFDILAHHPIQTSGGPRQSAFHPDDATTPDFKHVVDTLRAAEKRNKVAGGRHDAWATEIWWESNPPDEADGVPLKRHAAWNQESLYLLWKQGASAVINLLIRDTEFDPQDPSRSIEAGLFFHDGAPKPAFTAWRFPFVTDRQDKHRLLAWGKSPAAGRLVIESKHGGGWRREATLNVSAGEVFSTELGITGKASLRAAVAGERSLVWHQR